MENEEAIAAFLGYMRSIEWQTSEMVRVFRELVGSLYMLNESVNSIDSSLAEIRKFLTLGP